MNNGALNELSDPMTNNDVEDSRIELDSHANMPVASQNVTILAETGKMCKVMPFMPNYQVMQVLLVDAAI